LNVNAGHPMSIGFLRGPDHHVLLPSIENEYQYKINASVIRSQIECNRRRTLIGTLGAGS
jgi:hypothetical protein